jgi:hypothetical protein
MCTPNNQRAFGILRTLLLTVFIFILLIALLFFLDIGHIFNNDRIEHARRSLCKSNLRTIGNTLAEKNIHLKEGNIDEIKTILKDLNLKCPSGEKYHSDENASLYKVSLSPEGNVVITEDLKNHDTENMKFIGLAYIRYYLYESNRNGEGFIVGEIGH